MSKAPSIKKNYIYKLFYEVLTIITPFITAPYVSRVLGAKGIGIYSYSQSWIIYFTMFAALGTNSYGMREIARSRDNRDEYSKKFWEIELLTVATTLVCAVGWILFLGIYSEYRVYFWAWLPLLLATMFDVSWFFTGHEKIGYTVFWNALCKIAGVISIFIFVKSENDLLVYIILNTSITLIGNISMWLYLPKMLSKVSIKELKFRNHFHETLVYFIPTIAISVYTVLDKTLIGLITHDDYQNGYYEQANKIIKLVKTGVFVSINSVMGARNSYLFSENRIQEIKYKINKSVSFIMLLGYGAVFGIIAIAKDFVPLFFGEGYGPVVTHIYLMAPLVIIIGISNCLGSQYYNPAGLRAQSAKYIICGSIVNLIVNVMFIPFWGSIGAVVGSLIAESVISGLYLRNCGTYLTFKQLWMASYKRVISGVIMMASVIALSGVLGGVIGLIIRVSIGGAIYFVLLIIMKDTLVLELVGLCIKRMRKIG